MRIGYAISGGGARGIAHLGALQAFEEAGIKPCVISGVSAGAIVGTLYASGMSPIEIFERFSKIKFFKIVRPAWGKFGFLNIQKLQAIYQLYLPVKSFEELSVKLYISAADIRSGKSVFFSSGELIPPLLATTSIPVLFAPYEYDGKMLVDGGVINNLPCEPLLNQCDKIVAFHCNPNREDYKVGSIKSMIERTFHLAIYSNVIERKKMCDLVIEPPLLGRYTIFDFGKGKEIFRFGYEEAKKALDEHKDLIS